ncbi:SoxR-reducing system protein RseC [Candidatus Fukatsuia symbiotica]|uniref:SoxR reducing system protein RseC n=1 Tax=Candidatus Fukatsuia symbiotica TaxID=1878942 RepID=A0A2U8I6K7_9GAMM|nr:SoxR-reducing system protein RseC [Candidatus Fukatsuia symbiotica]AWK14806.1 SoxR reducing system protein RseC [Candidatus Fukatsuia symbiotica]MEA9445143.1 SoxR-reducing system protein RseC [Candidatus Fukatsuia symbiotica]
MMKEWATVISWQQGMALLSYQPRTGCKRCNSSGGCGKALLDEFFSRPEHRLQIPIAQALQPGQRVEVGIRGSSVLRSALLIYLTPLLGLIIGATVCQASFSNDAIAALGALIGGVGCFTVARRFAEKIATSSTYRPVILQIGSPPKS